MNTPKTLQVSLCIFLLMGAVGAAQHVRSGEWRTYAGGPHRLFFNPGERMITAANVSLLQVKWTFPTGAIVTASPSVARVHVRGEGRIPVAFLQSWDGYLYALRVRDGTELWRFQTALQPGAGFPHAASVDVRRVGGHERVYLAAGETVYALEAQPRIDRKMRQLSPDGSELVLFIDRPQLVQREITVANQASIRRFDEGELVDLAQPEGDAVVRHEDHEGAVVQASALEPVDEPAHGAVHGRHLELVGDGEWRLDRLTTAG